MRAYQRLNNGEKPRRREGVMDDACKRHGRVRCDECAEMGGLRARLAEANAEVKRLTTAWRAIDRANVSLRERLAAAQTRNVCPECGLTPGAISTCYCEECVGEIKEKLAAAETEVENLRLQCAAFDYSLTQAEDSAAARMQERDECRRLLREACEMPRYCTRFEDWKERAAKAGGCDA